MRFDQLLLMACKGVLFLWTSTLLAADPQIVYEGSGASAPKQPQASIDNQGVVHLAFGSGDQVFYARREADQFSQPKVVFRVPNMSLGMRRGPRIAAMDSCIVVTAIGGEQGKGKDGDILAYRSLDKGASWSGPVKVNDVQASAREGLHAMTCSADGTLWCVWLDLRNKRTELMLSKSTDQGASWSANQLVYQSPDRNICECCHPSIAVQGPIVRILFRNSVDGNRDMYVISSRDAGATFGKAERLGLQHWELNACPMDGGMLALSKDGEATAVWRRGGMIYVTRPAESAEEPLGKGEQAWIAMTPAGPRIVWTTGREGDLLLSGLDSQTPRKLSDNARDPIIVTNSTSTLVIACWEKRDQDKTSIVSQIINE